MILLSNTRHSPVALSGYGLAIVDELPIEAEAGPSQNAGDA